MIRAYVNLKDIQKGKRFDFSSCPVARSVRRKTHKKVCIYSSCARIGASAGFNGNYDLSPATQQFICNFDLGLPVKPFHAVLTAKAD